MERTCICQCHLGPENCGPNKQALPLGESAAVRMDGGRRGRAGGRGGEKELARGGPDPEEGGRKSQEERLETKRNRLGGKPPRREAVGPLGWTESHPIRMEARTACV